MAVNYTRDHTQLTASAAAVYTTPANTTAILEAVTATNAGTGAETLSIHLVDSGASAINSNLTVDAQSLSEGADAVIDVVIGHVLQEGDALYAFAGSTTSINLQVSVREIT